MPASNYDVDDEWDTEQRKMNLKNVVQTPRAGKSSDCVVSLGRNFNLWKLSDQ